MKRLIVALLFVTVALVIVVGIQHQTAVAADEQLTGGFGAPYVVAAPHSNFQCEVTIQFWGGYLAPEGDPVDYSTTIIVDGHTIRFFLLAGDGSWRQWFGTSDIEAHWIPDTVVSVGVLKPGSYQLISNGVKYPRKLQVPFGGSTNRKYCS